MFWCSDPENKKEVKEHETKFGELVNYLNNLPDNALLGHMSERGFNLTVKNSSDEKREAVSKPKWMPDKFVEDFIQDEHIFRVLSSRYPETIELTGVRDNKLGEYNFHRKIVEVLSKREKANP